MEFGGVVLCSLSHSLVEANCPLFEEIQAVELIVHEAACPLQHASLQEAGGETDSGGCRGEEGRDKKFNHKHSLLLWPEMHSVFVEGEDWLVHFFFE